MCFSRVQYLVDSQYSVQYVKKPLWLGIDKTDPYNRNSLAMEKLEKSHFIAGQKPSAHQC